MKVSTSGNTVRKLVRTWRCRGSKVAFVPTMGNLHEGHLSLVRKAQSLCERVVVSLFVNPAQFAPQEDLGSYPRTLRRDLALAGEIGVDCCFTPSAAGMYGKAHGTEIHIPAMESILEGATRPAHFAGVLLVVLKLLNIVEPDVLVLGQKDAQQAVVLETLVRDLDFPTRVVRGKVIREKNGLAMSSRNSYLTPDERRAAAALHQGLLMARTAAKLGERSAAVLKGMVVREIKKEHLLRLDYVACVDARTLRPLKHALGRVLMPAAVFVGPTRLIDNEQFVIRGET